MSHKSVRAGLPISVRTAPTATVPRSTKILRDVSANELNQGKRRPQTASTSGRSKTVKSGTGSNSSSSKKKKKSTSKKYFNTDDPLDPQTNNKSSDQTPSTQSSSHTTRIDDERPIRRRPTSSSSSSSSKKKKANSTHTKKHAWQEKPKPPASSSTLDKPARSTSPTLPQSTSLSPTRRSLSPSVKRAQLSATLQQRHRLQLAREELELRESMASAAEVEAHAHARKVFAERSLAPPGERPPFRPTSPSSAGLVGGIPGYGQFPKEELFPMFHTPALRHFENAAQVSAPTPNPFRKDQKRRELEREKKAKQIALGWFELDAKKHKNPPAPTYSNMKNPEEEKEQLTHPPTTTSNQPPSSPPVPAVAARFRRASLVETNQLPPSTAISSAPTASSKPAPTTSIQSLPSSTPFTSTLPARPTSLFSKPHFLRDKAKIEADKERKRVLRELRQLQRANEEEDRLAEQDQQALHDATLLWTTTRDRQTFLEDRTKYIEAEALRIQEAQRAEVTTYQERIVKIMHKNKEETLDTLDQNTRILAESKSRGAAELQAELAEMERLEQEISQNRMKFDTDVAAIQSRRLDVLQRVSQEIQCESMLRIHKLDQTFAAKEQALRAETKAAIKTAGLNQDVVLRNLTKQHATLIQQAKAQHEQTIKIHQQQRAYLQQQVYELRQSNQEKETRFNQRKDDLAEKTGRLESLTAESRSLNYSLDEAVIVRQELDHTNASILLLTDRCKAWTYAIQELGLVSAKSNEHRLALHDCFHQLISQLQSKNAELNATVQDQAIKYYDTLSQQEAERQDEVKKHPLAYRKIEDDQHIQMRSPKHQTNQEQKYDAPKAPTAAVFHESYLESSPPLTLSEPTDHDIDPQSPHHTSYSSYSSYSSTHTSFASSRHDSSVHSGSYQDDQTQPHPSHHHPDDLNQESSHMHPHSPLLTDRSRTDHTPGGDSVNESYGSRSLSRSTSFTDSPHTDRSYSTASYASPR